MVQMSILIYNWRDIKNPGAGGAEVFTHENAKRWVEKGNEVTYLPLRLRTVKEKSVKHPERTRRYPLIKRRIE